jgi:hypothetical protein
MPYLNLSPEIVVAAAIWLLALGIFAVMLLLVVMELISENRAKTHLDQKVISRGSGNLLQSAVRRFQRNKQA